LMSSKLMVSLESAAGMGVSFADLNGRVSTHLMMCMQDIMTACLERRLEPSPNTRWLAVGAVPGQPCMHAF
jgi:hypothetical protein